MRRQLKDSLKRALFRVYKLATRMGIHVIPVHYYSPVPTIIELERTKDEWAKKSELPGLPIDLDQQVENLRAICLPYQGEYAGNAAFCEAVAEHAGPGYGYVEAQALHSVIRHFKPKRIIEVGSGVSTLCMLTALDLNRKEGGHETTMTFVEPYPSPRLRNTPRIKLIEKKVQALPVDMFIEIGDGDFLFIDSSHAVKPGSDVNHLILEVLPRLQPGVIVHFHDIYLPYDYQRDVLKTFLHSSETSLLRAFLTHNDRVRIIFCLSHLHYERCDDLRQVFPEYDPQTGLNGLIPASTQAFEISANHFPSSIYLQTC